MPHHRPLSRLGPAFIVAVGLVVLALAGCGEKKKERPQTQVAARVNGHALTLPQINHVLEQQQNLRPDQVDAAGRRVLERLIDQRLLVEQAEHAELDRDPRVRERVDAAAREIVARAYAERIGEKAVAPTADEVAEYYRSHPERFEQRRIYTIQELAIEARTEQLGALREQLQASKSIGEFIEHLKADGYRFAGTQAVRAAEQLSPQALQTLSRLQDGQAALTTTGGGAVVTVLAGSRSEPLTLEQAKGAIEQQLLAERRRQLVEAELASLRKAARIEYGGRFAQAGEALPSDAGAASAAGISGD